MIFYVKDCNHFPFMHRKGKVQILAITCVVGNTSVDNVVTNIIRVLNLMGIPSEETPQEKDKPHILPIPVYRGASHALVHEVDLKPNLSIFGTDGFNDVKFVGTPGPEDERIKKEPAAQAIVSIVNAHPHKVTLVALGPLTNVAMAFHLADNLPFLLKDIFVMGGSLVGHGNTLAKDFAISAEFNFGMDAEAAYVVLNRGDKIREYLKGRREHKEERERCKLYLASWELCTQADPIDMGFRQELDEIQTPVAAFFKHIEGTDFTNTKDPWITCDPRAMLAALDHDAIRREHSIRATVETEGRYSRGQLIVDKRLDLKPEDHTDVPDGTDWNLPKVHVIDELDAEELKRKLRAAFQYDGGNQDEASVDTFTVENKGDVEEIPAAPKAKKRKAEVQTQSDSETEAKQIILGDEDVVG